MKSSKIIMLPLLSASFLLASCVEQQSTSSGNSRDSSQENNKNSFENSVNSSESSKPTPDVPHSADENFAILKGTMEKMTDANGFKTEITPFNATLGGIRYARNDDDSVKTTNWDVLLKASKVIETSTHTGNISSPDNVNQSIKVINGSLSKSKYGLGHLVSDEEGNAETINRLISALGKNMYANAYYAGELYPDRLYYDFDDPSGKTSMAGQLLKGITPFILPMLDNAGYSVYKNDNPKNIPTYEIQTKAYVSLNQGNNPSTDNPSIPTDSPLIGNEWEDILIGFLDAMKDKFPDNIVSSKTADTYTLTIDFSGKDVEKAIQEFLNSLEDDWSYTIDLPIGENQTTQIVITKDELQALSDKLKDATHLERFHYELTYNDKVLLNGALNMDLTINQSIYKDIFDERKNDPNYDPKTDGTMIGLTQIKLNQKMNYSIYQLSMDDIDQEVLKKHLWTYAALPSKEDLSNPSVYPEQKLPPKKEVTTN